MKIWLKSSETFRKHEFDKINKLCKVSRHFDDINIVFCYFEFFSCGFVLSDRGQMTCASKIQLFRRFEFLFAIFNVFILVKVQFFSSKISNVIFFSFDFYRFGSRIVAWKTNANVSSIGQLQQFIPTLHLLLHYSKLQPPRSVCHTMHQIRWFHKCLWSYQRLQFHRLPLIPMHTTIGIRHTKFHIETNPLFFPKHIHHR